MKLVVGCLFFEEVMQFDVQAEEIYIENGNFHWLL